jgi:hypothetical protein
LPRNAPSFKLAEIASLSVFHKNYEKVRKALI